VQANTVHPVVRRNAAVALRGVRERDSLGEIEAIRKHLRRTMHFVQDPVPYSELFTSARHLDTDPLGDCDDYTLRGATLLGSIGYVTDAEIISTNRDHTWSHIYLIVYFPSRTQNREISFDASLECPLGYKVPEKYVTRRTRVPLIGPWDGRIIDFPVARNAPGMPSMNGLAWVPLPNGGISPAYPPNPRGLNPGGVVVTGTSEEDGRIVWTADADLMPMVRSTPRTRAWIGRTGWKGRSVNRGLDPVMGRAARIKHSTFQGSDTIENVIEESLSGMGLGYGIPWGSSEVIEGYPGLGWSLHIPQVIQNAAAQIKANPVYQQVVHSPVVQMVQSVATQAAHATYVNATSAGKSITAAEQQALAAGKHVLDEAKKTAKKAASALKLTPLKKVILYVTTVPFPAGFALALPVVKKHKAEILAECPPSIRDFFIGMEQKLDDLFGGKTETLSGIPGIGGAFEDMDEWECLSGSLGAATWSDFKKKVAQAYDHLSPTDRKLLILLAVVLLIIIIIVTVYTVGAGTAFSIKGAVLAVQAAFKSFFLYIGWGGASMLFGMIVAWFKQKPSTPANVASTSTVVPPPPTPAQAKVITREILSEEPTHPVVKYGLPFGATAAAALLAL
jgi:hypothetical protein